MGWPEKFNYFSRSENFKNSRGQGKVEKVMHEYKTGALHSGSKSGPKVTNRKQAIAIAMSEAGQSRKKGK